MSTPVQNRAPKNVATALADDAAKISQIVKDVVADDARASEPSERHTVGEVFHEDAPVAAQDAPSAPAPAPTANAPAEREGAPEGLVRVRNRHVDSVCGIPPGGWAWIPKETAAKYPWAWRP